MPKVSLWKSLPSAHKDYVFIYMASILWAVTYFIFFPDATATLANQYFLALWIIPVLVGGGMALYGLLTRNNLLAERLGVTLLLIGPALYAVLQLGVTILYLASPVDDLDTTARIPLIIFSIWLLLFLNKRRRELKAKVKEARVTPLPSESGGAHE